MSSQMCFHKCPGVHIHVNVQLSSSMPVYLMCSCRCPSVLRQINTRCLCVTFSYVARKIAFVYLGCSCLERCSGSLFGKVNGLVRCYDLGMCWNIIFRCLKNTWTLYYFNKTHLNIVFRYLDTTVLVTKCVSSQEPRFTRFCPCSFMSIDHWPWSNSSDIF